jgi:hypothetical protein
MAQRLTVNNTDKSSTIPTVSGLALTNELANIAFPECSKKRWTFPVSPIANASTSGATPTELFINGQDSFRFRPANDSVVHCSLVVVYVSNQTASTHTLNFSILMRSNVFTFLTDNTNTKMPAASAATVGLALFPVGQLQVVATGIAGDTNGRWSGRLTITEVTDLG